LVRTKEVEMTDAPHARAGDVIDVVGHRVGEAHRLGEILEVIGAGDHEHYRVRWEDGRETIVYPAGDVVIRHGNGEAGR
jgi:hypothetical protein